MLQDLSGVQKLQKRLNLLEMDIAGHRSQIESLKEQATNFEIAGHFDAPIIREKQRALVTSYDSLQTPLKSLKEKLEASHQLQLFFRDIEDEWAWIKEREPLASSMNTGEGVWLVLVRDIMFLDLRCLCWIVIGAGKWKEMALIYTA